MAVVVEDGTGVPDANSVVSVATADTYFADRGVTVWATKTPEQKASYVIRGTEILFETYYRWQGFRTYVNQGLPFPRTGIDDIDGVVVPIDMVPKSIVSAALELGALIMIKGDLYESAETVSSGAVIEKTVGPITTKYSAPRADAVSSTAFRPTVPRVERLVAPYLLPFVFSLNLARG